MSKAGERLLKGAMQALEFAEGRAKAGTYRVHTPKGDDKPVAAESVKPSLRKTAKQTTVGVDEVSSPV